MWILLDALLSERQKRSACGKKEEVMAVMKVKAEIRSNNGYKAMLWVEGADELVGFEKPGNVTKERFLAELSS
jgi:hypothetical protein